MSSSSSHPPPGSCSHLVQFKSVGLNNYARLLRGLVAPASRVARSQAAQNLLCGECGHHRPQRGKGRLHVCLHCIFFACFPTHYKNHTQHHLLSADSVHGHIFCRACDDFVYDPEMSSIREQCLNRSYRSLGLGLQFHQWRPADPQETALLRKHRKRKGFTANSASTIGLRGLVNLGNTCFMSCIVQSLIHTPLLRDYFLSDQHLHPPHESNADDEPKQCLACEMSRLFQEFYSGAKTPLVPHILLHMTWTETRYLAGYEQQDAHEFFIATLNLLHRHLIIDRKQGVTTPANCDCIIDTIFTGKLQSDVVCQSCGNVSTTIDPLYDISLDLPTVGPISLQNCLERFTKPEHLGSAAKINCGRCQSQQESTKQLTMKKLPLVACFHLKRFEHSSKFHKKISTRVTFPEFLDMSPFVSHVRNNNVPASSSEYNAASNSSNSYTLFAVINHIGNIEAGHYTSFVRQHRDRWYRCNDHQIAPTDIKEVLESEGYLLFYHKQTLEYR